MSKSVLVVSTGTDSRTGKPIKCKGCQNNNEQEFEEHEEEPLLLTGYTLKRETEEDLDEETEEQPLIPPHKY